MKKLLTLLSLSVLLLAGCGRAGTQGPAYVQMAMNDALEQMKTESGYILLDVRRPDEFQAGHIPGAICIPNETIGSKEIPELPDKAQRIYVYCRSGNRSKQAAAKLAKLGYTNIIEFGGILEYPGTPVTD